MFISYRVIIYYKNRTFMERYYVYSRGRDAYVGESMRVSYVPFLNTCNVSDVLPNKTQVMNVFTDLHVYWNQQCT